MATLGSEGMVGQRAWFSSRASTCCVTSGKDSTSLTSAQSSVKRVPSTHPLWA